MASLLSFLSSALSLFNADGDEGSTFTISCAGESVIIPVEPSSFSVATTYNNDKVRLNNLGDVKMLGTKGLKDIEFSSFFPAQDYSFTPAGTAAPWELVDKLERFATIKPRQPCRLGISGTSINTAVAIDEFSYKLQDSTGDVYYTIKFGEYIYPLPTGNQLNDTTGLKSRVAEVQQETQTTVNRGEHLMDVANRVSRGVKIAEQGAKRIQIYKSLVKSNAGMGTLLVVRDGVLKKQ